MKIIVVIDSSKYKNHKEEFLKLEGRCHKANYSVGLLDISESLAEEEQYAALVREDADWIISFDMAGFSLRTELDSASYNNLHCKMAHILFRQMDEYLYLNNRMNFSMFLFLVSDNYNRELQQFKTKHPNLPNLEEFKDHTTLISWMSQIVC